MKEKKSKDYLDHYFDIVDGKVNYKNVGKKKRGRRAGYTHSEETKAKIAKKMTNRKKTEEVKQKISRSLLGREKPLETRIKISESKKDPKNNIATDMLLAYQGASKERDVPTTTAEWLHKCGHDKKELLDWIKEHEEEFKEVGGGDVRSESELNAELEKEKPDIELVYYLSGGYNHNG